MEMSANVVQESGIKPNWFGSIHSSIKGLSSRSITNLSATLDSVDVRDMGLKSLLKSSIEAPLKVRLNGALRSLCLAAMDEFKGFTWSDLAQLSDHQSCDPSFPPLDEYWYLHVR